MEDENRGIDDSNEHLSNIEALVSMLQSFVEGLKIGRLVHHDSYSLELTNAVERVKMLLQALPEDVTEWSIPLSSQYFQSLTKRFSQSHHQQ